jgi:transcriptional regulator with PAS, ATPase and Fis domain
MYEIGALMREQSVFGFEDDLGLVGGSPYLRGLRRQIRTMAAGDFPVLVQGESGTGKELVAAALHRCSPRGNRDLVTINCAAVPKHLEESEFFGHVRGAFTGADRSKEGLVALADKSTLFLDEIGETSADVQAKFLRVLDGGEFIPVGATARRRADIRVISATNRDLEEAVERGYFREDLYYRLRGVVINTRPLRQHVDDIPVLVNYFLNAQERLGLPRRIDDDAVRLLMSYRWPGNVRELRYTVEVLCVASMGSEVIDAGTTRTVLNLNAEEAAPPLMLYNEAKACMLREFEWKYFSELLRTSHGNVTQVAKAAGMYRPNVIRKLRKLGLHASDFRLSRRRSSRTGRREDS